MWDIILNKKIEAIIKLFELDKVKEALQRVGLQGSTMIEVKSFGLQRRCIKLYHRGVKYIVYFLPKVKIEITILNKTLEKITEAIYKAIQARHIGGGNIFVSSINGATYICNSESSINAL
ncbi:nitrogen regulatory protein P-II 1 [Bartonella australis AUST/NH1]|uniref:Nitrogen regulatory protein P-II n=1 Tax=Bartonella australis (strain Aust/NH1) TaxID=1094489 RepID=M1N3Z8_BARAA|nr:P-II family nitrogen regulator [Bartonella australis]AGF74629.1 nitrogen regulatory protein P-II 1 [Bartonella australis AUST/NH1]